MTTADRPKRRIEEIGDESRRRILDAAEELFAEKGFDRTSFVDIAARSGISRGSIPWHFQNKDGLLVAVVERVNERFMTTDATDPGELSMRDLTLELRTMLRSGPQGGLLFMLFTEAMSTEGLVHEQYVAYLRGRRTLVKKWMQFHDKTSSLSPAEAGPMAAILTGALLGIQLQWQIDPESIDLDKTLDVFATLVDEQLVGTGTVGMKATKVRRTAKKPAASQQQ